MSDVIRSQFFLPFVVAAALVVALAWVLYRTWVALRELRLRQQEGSQEQQRLKVSSTWPTEWKLWGSWPGASSTT